MCVDAYSFHEIKERCVVVPCMHRDSCKRHKFTGKFIPGRLIAMPIISKTYILLMLTRMLLSALFAKFSLRTESLLFNIVRGFRRQFLQRCLCTSYSCLVVFLAQESKGKNCIETMNIVVLPYMCYRQSVTY